MDYLLEILIPWVGTLLDQASALLSLFAAGGCDPAGSALVLSLAFAITTEYGKMQEAFRAAARRWHGRIGEQFANVDHLVRRVEEHQKEWQMPEDMFDMLVDCRDRLAIIVPHCQSGDVGPKERAERDRLLKTSVNLCRNQVKEWAYGQLAEGTMTVDDIHSLFLFAPGDIGGHRSRSLPTNEEAKVAVHVIGSDFVRVVFTHAAGKNNAGVSHGWPTGVRFALIVITSVEDRTEVVHRITTRRYNTIAMPQGSHGKPFIIEVAFLKHVEDFPRFSPQQTFTMPFLTEEIMENVSRKRIENKGYANEMEELKQTVQRLAAELEEWRKRR